MGDESPKLTRVVEFYLSLTDAHLIVVKRECHAIGVAPSI
jgi:hypothetical protein